MYLVTAAQMRQMDETTIESFGLPGRVLMENAGRGATRRLMEVFPEARHQKIAVLAGRGNNGGDGFVMARYLFQKGVRVTVFLLSTEDRVAGDAAANLDLLHKLGLPVICLPDEAAFAGHRPALAHHHILVDAILGTGLTKTVQGYFKSVIAHINQSGKPVFAVDVPSGLDADTGRPCGICVQARATATFGYAKTGLMLYPGAALAGDLKIIDIGIPPSVADQVSPDQWLITNRLAADCFRPRSPEAHKGHAGHLLTVAGSPGKTGAAVLTAEAAMRIGAGLVTLAVPAGILPLVAPALTEVMTLPVGEAATRIFDAFCRDEIGTALSGKSCLALGPGLGTDEATCTLVREIIETCPLPMVIDADGLNCLADRPEILKHTSVPAVITPHPGEMARLMHTTSDRVQADRITSARTLAASLNVHVVLKGAGTVIAHPDGRVFINRTGNPGMASGGMGDVLTGMIAGLICQGYDCEQACHLGVYLHGVAADMVHQETAAHGYLASEVMTTIPHAIAALNNIMDDDRDTPCL